MPGGCDDADVCTADSCAAAGKTCKHTPLQTGAPCEDGDPCTEQSTCKSGACGGGQPVVCGDGELCVTASCDSAIGCLYAAKTPALGSCGGTGYCAPLAGPLAARCVCPAGSWLSPQKCTACGCSAQATLPGVAVAQAFVAGQPSTVGGVDIAMALNGARLAVGDRRDDYKGTDVGSVAMYTKKQAYQPWSLETKLYPSKSTTGDHFGASVALGPARLAVGSPGATLQYGNDGIVWIFERQASGAWQQVAKLVRPSPPVARRFGATVALDGDRLVVASVAGDWISITDEPMVYVFDRAKSGSWQASATLTNGTLYHWSGFGRSLALSGDRVVVGAPGLMFLGTPDVPINGSSVGAAVVYERRPNGSWALDGLLVAHEVNPNDDAGASVAMVGDQVFVGAPGAHVNGAAVGAVQVFRRSAAGDWRWRRNLAPVGAALVLGFGAALSAVPTGVVVGAPGGGTAQPGSGSVHVYGRTVSGEVTPIGRVDAGQRVSLGAAVVTSGAGTFITSWPSATSSDKKAVIYRIQYSNHAGTCGGQGKCNCKAGFTGIKCSTKVSECNLPAKCDDGLPCTKDSCVAAAGTCKHIPLPDGTTCADGDACTTKTVCSQGKCAGGEAVLCQSDDNPCTIDVCDSKNGCGHQATASGSVCGGSGMCAPDATCVCPPAKRLASGSCVPCGCSGPGSKLSFGLAHVATLTTPGKHVLAKAGTTLSVDGAWLAVGAPWDSAQAAHAGSVSLFARQTDGSWAFSARIFDSKNAKLRHFGTSVALRGDRLLVGAAGGSFSGVLSGQAYFFEVNKAAIWQQVATAPASKPDDWGAFGRSVALADKFAAVSTLATTDLLTQDASEKWSLVKVLSPNSPTKKSNQPSGMFGVDLLFNDTQLFAGWTNDDQQPSHSGQVDIYAQQTNGAWTLSQTLLVKSPTSKADVGASLSVDGDWLVAGAPRESTLGVRAGAAYTFKKQAVSGGKGVWQQTQKILADDGDARDLFGLAVALQDDDLLIGAPGADHAGISSGAVYRYRLNSGGLWQFIAQVSGSHQDERLGASLVAHGADWFVGAPGSHHFSGATKVFRLEAYSCNKSGACNCAPGFAGKKCAPGG